MPRSGGKAQRRLIRNPMLNVHRPTQQELAIALSELARNRHFITVLHHLNAERDDLVYLVSSGVGERTEMLGAISRAAGGITALSSFLEQCLTFSKTLDETAKQVSASATDGAAGSGRDH